MNIQWSSLFMPAGASLLLCACGGSDAPAPTSALPAMAAGAYQVRAQGDSPGTGLALVGSSGRSVVLLSDDGDAPARVVHVGEGTAGRRVPPGSGFVTLGYARSEPVALTPLTGTALAGTYQLLLDGRAVGLSIGSDGRISPAATATCRASGQVDLDSSLGGARSLSLALENCGTVASGPYQGVLFTMATTAPAAWQAVLENGQAVLDLVAYR